MTNIKAFDRASKVEEEIYSCIKHVIDVKQEKPIATLTVQLAVEEKSSYIQVFFANDIKEKTISLTSEDVDIIFANLKLKKNFEIPNFAQSILITLGSDYFVPLITVTYIPLRDLTAQEEEETLRDEEES